MIFSSCFDGLLALLLPDGFAFFCSQIPADVLDPSIAFSVAQ